MRFKIVVFMSTCFISVLLVLLLCTIARSQEKSDFPVLQGPYLGQKPPGKTPEPFAHGLLSTPGSSAIGISVTPDGKEIYYTSWGGETKTVIMVTRLNNDHWTKPQVVSFSGKHQDWDMNISPDGNSIFFTSKRPFEENGNPLERGDIWFVDRQSSGDWGEPVWLGQPVNTDLPEVHPTVSENRTLYFFSAEPGKMPDIYCAKFVNHKYLKPEKLGNLINTDYADMDPFIAPDESYLIFHSNRPGGLGSNDLYICFFNKKEGAWMQPVNMGSPVNSENNEYCARVSPDGQYMFFSRREGGRGEFYWMDAGIIEELRSKMNRKTNSPSPSESVIKIFEQGVER